jgi:microcin C transport system substrate-binding protein
LSTKSLWRSCAAAVLIATPVLFGAQAIVDHVRAQGNAPGSAQEPPEKVWRHGLSLFGDLKYPPGFKQFDYVNPNAPKGGSVRLTGFGTYDNFNIVVAGVKGNLALGLTYVYETLMTPAPDEVSTEYGLLAESVSHPDDFASVTYRLRASAKWHDGKPVTPEDVIFSYDASKKNSPQLAAYYQHVVKAEKTGERDITFTFDSPGNRELPQIVGQLDILPKHWFEGTDKSGNKRSVENTSLEPPLGSGPYRIKEFAPGRSITYERVKEYWGKDLPVKIGTDNFDEIRFDYYRDSTVALEAFKADQLDLRLENVARNWATAYDFPAVTDKRVVREEFPIRNSGLMVGFVLNTRRAKFSDPRVRRAFDLALDFEEMNKQFFFGSYTRISSYFDGSELASSGLPSGLELEILNTVRDQVPSEVFTEEYKNPVGGNAENVRNNLREATRLLREAGWEIRNQRLVNVKTGEAMAVEFLSSDPVTERFILFYKPSLERLGVTVTVRTVDAAQYEERERKWDFDIVTGSWRESLSPGNEQRGFWGSQAADQQGSRNLIGIKNPAVDKLIDRVVFAKSRTELVAATKALDRVLLWNHYLVPEWNYGKDRTARWDRFGHPDKLPEYSRIGSFPNIWWWDAAKAAKTGGRQ